MFQETKELLIPGPTVDPRRVELFEGIMRGCIMFPHQTFYRVRQGDDGACVVGAATAGDVRYHTWAWASATRVETCPDLDCSINLGLCLSLTNMMIHLNNQHRWPREKIAGWIINGT